MNVNVVLVGVLLLLNSVDAIACVESEKIGYWWYCEPEVEEENIRKELPPPPAHSEMMKMHPDDLEAKMELYLKEAVWKTTPEKVLNYYMVMDVTRKKSLAFTAVSNLVMLKNPELNAWGQYVKTNPGRRALTKARQSETNQILTQFRNKYALIIFTTETCHFCYTQKATLKYFTERHGWAVREVDINKYPAMAARFNVQTTPLTILIKKDSDDWMPIAVGEEALPTIEENTYRAIRYLGGQTTPAQFLNMQYQDGGVKDPNNSIRAQR